VSRGCEWTKSGEKRTPTDSTQCPLKKNNVKQMHSQNSENAQHNTSRDSLCIHNNSSHLTNSTITTATTHKNDSYSSQNSGITLFIAIWIGFNSKTTKPTYWTSEFCLPNQKTPFSSLPNFLNVGPIYQNNEILNLILCWITWHFWNLTPQRIQYNRRQDPSIMASHPRAWLCTTTSC